MPLRTAQEIVQNWYDRFISNLAEARKQHDYSRLAIALRSRTRTEAISYGQLVAERVDSYTLAHEPERYETRKEARERYIHACERVHVLWKQRPPAETWTFEGEPLPGTHQHALEVAERQREDALEAWVNA